MASIPGTSGSSGGGGDGEANQPPINIEPPPPVYDKTTFCNFTFGGCKVTKIPRHLRFAHEIQCAFNPSPSGVNFCQTFDATRACQFRICPNAIIRDHQHVQEVLHHLTSGHTPNLPLQKVKLGENVKLRFRLPTSLNAPRFAPVGLFEVYRGTTKQIIVGYYALIQRVEMPWLPNLSWAIVGFSSAPDPLGSKQNQINRKILVKLAIKAKADPGKVAKDGEGCVPNQTWTVKSIFLKEWQEFMRIPEDQRPLFNYQLPVMFLSDYYEQEDRMCEIGMCFGPIVI